MVQLLGTAPAALQGFADSLRLTADAYDETDQQSATDQTRDVDTEVPTTNLEIWKAIDEGEDPTDPDSKDPS